VTVIAPGHAPDGQYELVLDSTDHQGSLPVSLRGSARTVDLQAVSLR